MDYLLLAVYLGALLLGILGPIFFLCLYRTVSSCGR
jgi:hypothetical protein